MNKLAIIISDIPVRQDAENRYCLNDLHKASGGEKRHQPSDWLRTQQAIELAEEVSIPGILGIQSKQGLGTYVVKELVYAYAMWISPAFSLKVIRTFDALVTGQLQPALPSNDYAALQSKYIALLEQENNRLKAAEAPEYHGKYKRWTQAEDAIIREKRKLGWGAQRIHHVLDRSAVSVQHRIRRLEV